MSTVCSILLFVWLCGSSFGNGVFWGESCDDFTLSPFHNRKTTMLYLPGSDHCPVAEEVVVVREEVSSKEKGRGFIVVFTCGRW